MFVHCVYFWLKPELDPVEKQTFLKGLDDLTKIHSVRYGWYGMPAATNRPVIDRTYSYGLVVVFDNEAGHDAYQIDPVHTNFRVGLKDVWTNVRIHDFET